MLLRIADDKKAADDPTIINQVPPNDLSNASFIASIVLLFSSLEFDQSPGITDTIQKIKANNKFTNNAIIDIILAALGPKRFVITSLVKNDNQEKRNAVSSANQSTFILIDLFAKRFIPTTDKKKNETHKDGTLFVSISNSSKNAFIF